MIYLTENAVKKFKQELEDNKDVLGIRLEIQGKGCSGYSYVLGLAKETEQDDLIIENDGLKLFVDPMSMTYVKGTTIDYENHLFSSRFSFNNPNETGKCGCGESFRI